MVGYGEFNLAARRGRTERPQDVWLGAGKEPRLEDMLADPVVLAVMRRDQVAPAQLRLLLTEAQARLRRELCRRYAA